MIKQFLSRAFTSIIIIVFFAIYFAFPEELFDFLDSGLFLFLCGASSIIDLMFSNIDGFIVQEYSIRVRNLKHQLGSASLLKRRYIKLMILLIDIKESITKRHVTSEQRKNLLIAAVYIIFLMLIFIFDIVKIGNAIVILISEIVKIIYSYIDSKNKLPNQPVNYTRLKYLINAELGDTFIVDINNENILIKNKRHNNLYKIIFNTQSKEIQLKELKVQSLLDEYIYNIASMLYRETNYNIEFYYKGKKMITVK